MQRAPYPIKTRLWVTTAEAFASLTAKSGGGGVWFTSSPQFRIGRLRRAVIRDADDALRMTSLIAALPKSVDELAVESSSYELPMIGLLNPIVYPVQLTALFLDAVRLPDHAAPLALPPNLLTLALPYCPDHIRWQDVVPVLPESLHTLRLGGFALKRSLKEFIFPPNLTELNMGKWIGPVAELPPLPTGLCTLALPLLSKGVCDLPKRLPSSVTELFFDKSVVESLDDVEWPPSIRMMRFSYQKRLHNWRPPPALETLHLFWDVPCSLHLSLSNLCLPATLQRLNLWGGGSIDASYCWPPTLRALHLQFIELSLPDVQWPATLEELEFSIMVWDLPCHQLRLPPRLRKLRLGNGFNRSVEGLELPSTLEWLGFGDSFDQPVEGVLRLPMQLQQLHFGSGTTRDEFNQPLMNMQWPSSLQSLFLPSSLELSLEGLPRLLPASLRALHRYVESDDATIESGWIAIVASLPRCEMILHSPTTRYPDPQQISFELFK